MGYRNDTQPDPRYFDFGNAFMGGIQQAEDTQRRDQLIGIEQQQYGLQERRQGMMEEQYMRELQAQKAQRQQQQASRAQYAKLFEEVGLDPGLADTEGADELAQHILEQRTAAPEQPKLMKGPGGVMVPEVAGAQSYMEPPSAGPTGGDRQAYMQWYLAQPPEVQAKINEANRGYSGPEGAEDISEARARGRAVGDAAGDRQAKEPILESLGYVVSEIDKQLDETTTGGPLGLAGRVGGVTDSQDAMRFDNLQQQLSTELRAIFRIPGEGTLSDWEQKQYGLQLPDRKYSAANNRKILGDIKTRSAARVTGELSTNQSSATPKRVKVDADGNVIGN